MPFGKVEPDGVLVGELIQDITRGHIKIPAFQRGFVWTQDQVISLLDSIYNDFPIGSILLWNSKERLRSVRNIGGLLLPDIDPDYPLNYVLDGQQRLSVIYGVFAHEKQIDLQKDKYIVDPQFFDIYFDLSTEKFIPKSEFSADPANYDEFPLLDKLAKDSKYLKLDSLFSAREFLNQTRQLDEKYLDLATNVQAKFQGYKVPVVVIKNRSTEEVGVIFERINNTGTKLSTLDLMVAWTWSEDFHLRDTIIEILEILAAKGFDTLPEKRVLQCLSAIIDQTASTKDIMGLDAEAVRSNVDSLRSSMELSVDFLASELNVTSIDFLPHSHQIIPLAYFFSKTTYPTQEQREALTHWFWATSFSRRYAGSTDLRVNEDIEFISRILRGNYSEVKSYTHSMSQELLMNSEFSISSPVTRAFLLLLAQKQPRDLLYGNKITVGAALARYNIKEYHHIFPKDFLKRSGIKKHVNSICNFCFLPTNVNKKISNRPPSDYLYGRIATEPLFQVSGSESLTPAVRTQVLDSNLMPLDEDIYKQNQFQNFLELRAQIVLDYLNTKLER